MDAFLEVDVGETEINSTPNIEFQVDKYNYISHNHTSHITHHKQFTKNIVRKPKNTPAILTKNIYIL